MLFVIVVGVVSILFTVFVDSGTALLFFAKLATLFWSVPVIIIADSLLSLS